MRYLNGVTDNLALNRQLCFALYAASRATTAMYRPLLEPLGLTYPQYLVLLALWEQEPRSVRELGEALDLDSGTLSPLLKRLESMGLVERRRAATDERRVDVALTDVGRDLRSKAQSIPDCVARATQLSEPEIIALRDDLVTLTATLKNSSNAEQSHAKESH